MQEAEERAEEGRELGRWLYLDLSAGFNRQTRRKPSYFPTSPKARPGENCQQNCFGFEAVSDFVYSFQTDSTCVSQGRGALSRATRGGTNLTPVLPRAGTDRGELPTATAGDKAG